MSVGLLILVAMEGYRATRRTHNKRRAIKYGYEHLEHDHLWRPMDAGKRLSRNEARALAQHRRHADESRRAQQAWLDKGNTLPDYGQVQQADGEQRRQWQEAGDSSSSSGSSSQSRGSEEGAEQLRPTSPRSVSHHADRRTSQTPEAELLRMSWSASPPYRFNDSTTV